MFEKQTIRGWKPICHFRTLGESATPTKHGPWRFHQQGCLRFWCRGHFHSTPLKRPGQETKAPSVTLRTIIKPSPPPRWAGTLRQATGRAAPAAGTARGPPGSAAGGRPTRTRTRGGGTHTPSARDRAGREGLVGPPPTTTPRKENSAQRREEILTEKNWRIGGNGLVGGSGIPAQPWPAGVLLAAGLQRL